MSLTKAVDCLIISDVVFPLDAFAPHGQLRKALYSSFPSFSSLIQEFFTPNRGRRSLFLDGEVDFPPRTPQSACYIPLPPLLKSAFFPYGERLVSSEARIVGSYPLPA